MRRPIRRPAVWVPGQIVTDDHSLKVVDPAYRGPATLIVGWYNSATIERVPAAQRRRFCEVVRAGSIEEK